MARIWLFALIRCHLWQRWRHTAPGATHSLFRRPAVPALKQELPSLKLETITVLWLLSSKIQSSPKSQTKPGKVPSKSHSPSTDTFLCFIKISCHENMLSYVGFAFKGLIILDLRKQKSHFSIPKIHNEEVTELSGRELKGWWQHEKDYDIR